MVFLSAFVDNLLLKVFFILPDVNKEIMHLSWGLCTAPP